MTESEVLLIQNSQQGDLKSFEQLIGQYQLYAYNIAYRMLGHEEDAKDAAQDALIKVYKNIGQFDGNSKFSTWLYRIVVNTCKDQLKMKHKKWVSLESEEQDVQQWIDTVADKSEDRPEQVLERKETQSRIHEALDQLSPSHKSVILLRDVQGLTYEEISDIESCSVGTVKSRINRGRLALRALLLKDEYLRQEGVI